MITAVLVVVVSAVLVEAAAMGAGDGGGGEEGEEQGDGFHGVEDYGGPVCFNILFCHTWIVTRLPHSFQDGRVGRLCLGQLALVGRLF